MFYFGKYIDTFESAFRQMLSYHGVGSLEHIDCIGKRCFGFLIGGNVRDWFRPAVSIRMAIELISEKTGLDLFVAEEKTDPEAVLEILQKGAVMGPVRKGIAVTEVRHLYYHGDAHYLFVAEEEGKGFQMTDPEGYPAIPIDRKLLLEILSLDRPSILYINAEKPKIYKEIDYDMILKEGLAFHDSFQKNTEHMIQTAVSQYEDTAGNRLALQYGLMNYVLQINKSFRLAEFCGYMDKEMRNIYQEQLDAVYCINRDRNVQELPKLVREIWELLKAMVNKGGNPMLSSV